MIFRLFLAVSLVALLIVVLCIRLRRPTEVIQHAVNGLLSPFGDSEKLGKNILPILDQPDFAQRLGAAARNTAREFSVQRYAANLIEAVQDLLNPDVVVFARSRS